VSLSQIGSLDQTGGARGALGAGGSGCGSSALTDVAVNVTTNKTASKIASAFLIVLKVCFLMGIYSYHILYFVQFDTILRFSKFSSLDQFPAGRYTAEMSIYPHGFRVNSHTTSIGSSFKIVS
jgi:hypothetical protein